MKAIWPLLVWGRRHPKSSIVVGAVAMLLLISGVASAVSPAKSSASSGVSTIPAPSPTADSALPTESASPTATPAQTPTPSATPSPTVSPTPASALVITAAGAIKPDSALTPGQTFAGVTAAQVCVSGYSASVRDVPDSVRRAVFAAYGIDYAQHAQYELDHLISLELGGDNAGANLWPEPLNGSGGAKVKDKIEDKLHSLVCSGQLSLSTAQQAIARDWSAAYAKYYGIAVVYPTQAPAPVYTPPPPAYTPPAPVYTQPAPAPAGNVVHPGSFCAPQGATGVTDRGTPMVCGPASDGRNRWHSG